MNHHSSNIQTISVFFSMEEHVLLLCSLAFVLLLYGAVRVSYSIFWKPKWLERQLKRQGIRGTPYRPLIGDMKEFVRLIKEAWSKPMSLTHQIVSRVDPFTLTIMQKYGNTPCELCFYSERCYLHSRKAIMHSFLISYKNLKVL